MEGDPATRAGLEKALSSLVAELVDTNESLHPQAHSSLEVHDTRALSIQAKSSPSGQRPDCRTGISSAGQIINSQTAAAQSINSIARIHQELRHPFQRGKPATARPASARPAELSGAFSADFASQLSGERPLLTAGPWAHVGRRPASAMAATGQWPGRMKGPRPATTRAAVSIPGSPFRLPPEALNGAAAGGRPGGEATPKRPASASGMSWGHVATTMAAVRPEGARAIASTVVVPREKMGQSVSIGWDVGSIKARSPPAAR